jgi:CRISPR-associated protein Cas7/Cst2/DevR subtype I-B
MAEDTKSLSAATLTHIDLGNHNAGEGGSQLSDLKRIGNRPYISGQAFRHAVKDALRAETSEGVDCTPQYACGEISECKMCDLFGYMNTDLDPNDGDPLPKRTSPLRVTPLVGQYDASTTTDMILQYAVGGDVKKTEEGETNDEMLENRIGYREMTENVFKGAWAIDVDAIGRREVEDIDTSQDHGERYSRDLENEISDSDRVERIGELLTALMNTTQLAGQARHMADFMPDLVISAALPVYNQRILNSLHVDPESRELNVEALRSVLADLKNQDANVWMAGTHNPNVISNWDEVMDVGSTMDHVSVVDSVTDCYEVMQSHIDTEG